MSSLHLEFFLSQCIYFSLVLIWVNGISIYSAPNTDDAVAKIFLINLSHSVSAIVLGWTSSSLICTWEFLPDSIILGVLAPQTHSSKWSHNDLTTAHVVYAAAPGVFSYFTLCSSLFCRITFIKLSSLSGFISHLFFLVSWKSFLLLSNSRGKCSFHAACVQTG